MKYKWKYMVAGSSLAAALLGATPAMAAGTTAGTDITNTVTVDFKVGGVDQTQQQASDTFKVDRKVNLTVAQSDSATTTVVPGQNGAVTTFRVTNTSNAVLDFSLAASQLSGGTAENGGTDNFDVTNLKVFVDSNGNGVYDAGVDTATFIDELAADATVTVFVLGDIALNRVNGDVAGVRLTATANEGGTAASLGAVVTQSTGADTDGVETVFADGAGDTDAVRDGKFSDGDDYTVSAADIEVVKISTVIEDPFNGTDNPKAIPGATVEYCIAVFNGSGANTATSVSINDTIPANLTYVSSFGVQVNGTVTGDSSSFTCNDDDTATGSQSGGDVSGTISSIAGGAARTLRFRVTVD